MINVNSLIRKNIFIFAILALGIVFLKRIDILLGIFSGMIIATLNFVFLQKSVKIMFNKSKNENQSNISSGLIRKYFLLEFFKFTIIIIVLFLLVKFAKVDWVGILVGLIVSTFIFIFELVRLRNCQLSRNQ